MAVIRTEEEANSLERPAAGDANNDAADNLPDEEYPPFDGQEKK